MGENDFDPREMGVEGLTGMKGLNYSNRRAVKQGIQIHNMDALSQPAVTDIGADFPELGKSRYDRKITSVSDLYNLSDFRGREQSGLLQVTNGIAKGAVLAGTTFLDGTVGLVVGGLDAIAEGDASKLWDNPFSQAMQSVNKYAEEALPNYYTDEEINDPWYKHILSGNFIGDKLLKNIGFTVGAYYSGSVWTKPLSMINMVKNAKVGATVASGLGATLSAVNEGRIEALNNSTDWFNLQKAQLDDAFSKKVQELSVFDGTEAYDSLLAKVQDSYNTSLQDLQDKKSKMGNADLLFNLPILLASNLVEFGKLYSRGFSTAAKFDKIVGTPGQYVSDFTKLGKAAAIAKTATAEGTEEVLQQLASNVAGIKYAPEGFNLSIHQAGIDDIAEQETIGWMKAFAQGLNETINDGSTWEQWFIGALTGALGMPTFGRANNSDAWLGKDKMIGLSGGMVGTARDYNREKEQTDALVQRMNERIQSPEFLNYYQGLVRHNKFQNDMNRAAAEGKAKEFKDAEYAQMISDISMFAKAGRLGDYRDLLSSAYDTSDENLQSIITNTTSQQTASDGKEVSIGPFIDSDGNPMTSTESGKAKMIEKLTSSRDEMLKAVDEYSRINEQLSTKFGSRISDSQREELVWYNLLSTNQRERAISIAEQTKPYIKAIADDMRTEAEELDLVSQYSGEPLTGSLKTKFDNLSRNIEVLDKLSASKPEVVAATLANNKTLSRLVKAKLSSDLVESNLGKLAEDVKQDIDDIGDLIEGSAKYAEKVQEYLANPEKIAESQEKEVKKEEKKINNRKVSQIGTALENAKTLEEVRALVNSAKSEEDKRLVSEALTKSSNPKVQEYNNLVSKVNAVKKQLSRNSDDLELNDDAAKLLDRLLEDAQSDKDFDLESLLLKDEARLQDRNGETPEAKTQRMGNVRTLISQAMKEVDTTPAVDFSLPVGTVEVKATPKGLDSSDDNPNLSDLKPVERQESTVIQETSDDEENVHLGTKDSDPIITSPDAKSVESIQEVNSESEEPRPTDGEVEPYWRGAVSQYDLSKMRVGEFVPNSNEEWQRVNTYLYGTHRAGDFINSGQLQDYVRKGGKIYFGFDPSFDENTPLMFVKIGDEYRPIQSMFVSKAKIKTFAGLTEFMDRLKAEYQENKPAEGQFFISKETSTVQTVMPGRFQYISDTVSVKQALEGTGLGTPNITVATLSGLENKSPEARDVVNLSDKVGMAYVEIPNAKVGGRGGYSQVSILPVKVSSQLLAGDNPVIQDINSALSILSESLAAKDRARMLEGLTLLSEDVNLKYLDISLNPKTGEVFINRRHFQKDGTPLNIHKGDKFFQKTTTITRLPATAGSETIRTALISALEGLGCSIRINKNKVSDKTYVDNLIEGGLIVTHCPSLKAQAAWFTVNPVSQNLETKDSEVTEPQNKELTTEEKRSARQSRLDRLKSKDAGQSKQPEGYTKPSPRLVSRPNQNGTMTPRELTSQEVEALLNDGHTKEWVETEASENDINAALTCLGF